ncbi:hypothetical protein BJY01DRAFT_254468 [Aspergillus pseudoustus]|uniref:Uncharacterized protein n=1 Tax=Aspergillus pseudoustus TaxID=1810923 RepID=A0ABR4IT78_9EURO
MPMIWSAEANVQLLVGMLAQLKDQSVKLDYKQLAEHMGSECNAKSVMNQFTKLKKQAAEIPTDAAGKGNAEGDQAGTSAAASEAKPAAPKKRRAKGTAGKKKKKKTKVESQNGESMYEDVKHAEAA